MANNGICVKCDAEFPSARYVCLQPHERITCKYCCHQMRRCDADAARNARDEAKRRRRNQKWYRRHPSPWVKLWRRMNPFALTAAAACITFFWVPSDQALHDKNTVVGILGLIWVGAAGIVRQYFCNLAESCGKRSRAYWHAEYHLAACGMRVLAFGLLLLAAAWPLRSVEEQRR
jgi:hypothetical protein